MYDDRDAVTAGLDQPEGSVGVLVEVRTVVVRDHQDLKAQSASGVANDFDEARNKIGPEPAILFVQHEESAVL